MNLSSLFLAKKFFLKKLRILSFLFFFLFPLPSSFAADADPSENTTCQSAWSEAFDTATNHLINVELPPFLQQNTVSGADLWSGYRKFSLRHECLLRAVCKVATENALDDQFLALENTLGGVVPGDFFECPTGVSSGEEKRVFQMKFKDYLSPVDVDTEELREACSEDVSKKDNARDYSTKQRYYCDEHLDISIKIFDRVLENMIFKDINRKRAGFISVKITSLRNRIQKVNEDLATFVQSANGYFRKICTLKKVSK